MDDIAEFNDKVLAGMKNRKCKELETREDQMEFLKKCRNEIR